MSENYFYELVKKWTVNDYKTPGVKAEVILDMLISEFVEDIIEYHFSKSNGNRGKVKLLAKEFPIRKHDENENKENTKVDYLVSIGVKKLLFVELKTTLDSFNYKQLNRIKEATGHDAEKLIDFYYSCIGFRKIEFDEKNFKPVEWIRKHGAVKRRKNLYACEKFKENLLDTPFGEETVKGVKELDYLYISLTDSSKLPDKKIVLKDYCKNGKNEDFKDSIKDVKRREQWELVSEILLECAEFAKGYEK